MKRKKTVEQAWIKLKGAPEKYNGNADLIVTSDWNINTLAVSSKKP